MRQKLIHLINLIDKYASEEAKQNKIEEFLKSMGNKQAKVKLSARDKEETSEPTEVPRSEIEKWHKNPPLPFMKTEPGDERYLVYRKYYYPHIGLGGIQYGMIPAKNEDDARQKAQKTILRNYNLNDIGVSKETPEHVAYLEKKKEKHRKEMQELEVFWEKERANKKREEAREAAQREWNYAQEKGEKHRDYNYHMKEFAKHMINGSESPEDIAKYKAMQIEHELLHKAQPQMTHEEKVKALESLLDNLENLKNPKPNFSPPSFKKDKN